MTAQMTQDLTPEQRDHLAREAASLTYRRAQARVALAYAVDLARRDLTQQDCADVMRSTLHVG